MNPNTAKITIDRVAYGGKGVARVDGKVWFVPGTVPGDEVIAEITEDHARYADAKVKEWVVKSDLHQPSPCAYSEECGGCQWLTIPYETQLEWKRSFVESGLKRIGRMADAGEVKIHGSPSPLNYRNRILVRAYGTGGGLDVGYFRSSSRDLVKIERCAIADPELNKFLAALRTVKGEAGSKWRLECQVLADGKVAVTVYPGEREMQGNEELVQQLNDLPIVAWAGLVFDVKKAPLMQLEQDLDLTFHTFPGQFQQVNSRLNQQLRRIVKDLVDDRHPERILDVFCGSGNLSLVVAGPGRYVEAVEVNTKAIVVGHRNVEANKLEGINFLTGDAEAHLKKCAKKGEKFDLVILDPPRQGMHKGLASLIEINPQTIVYVSCDPNTLSRDIAGLTKKGTYKLVSIEALDFFPNTFHVETIAVLERA